MLVGYSRIINLIFSCNICKLCNDYFIGVKVS